MGKSHTETRCISLLRYGLAYNLELGKYRMLLQFKAEKHETLYVWEKHSSWKPSFEVGVADMARKYIHEWSAN